MYKNSRFLKNRFTFCGVNTNFGQQWAPPAYYHLTPIVSKGKHCTTMLHFISAWHLNIFKNCNSGYLNLRIYSPIEFCHGHLFQWYWKLTSFTSHVGYNYKILRCHSPEEFFMALAIGLLFYPTTVLEQSELTGVPSGLTQQGCSGRWHLSKLGIKPCGWIMPNCQQHAHRPSLE